MSRPPVTFANLEEAVRSYLAEKLDLVIGPELPDFGVYIAVPSPLPPVWIRILRVGGARVNLVQTDATFVVEAWAGLEGQPAPYYADHLSRAALAYLHAARGETLIGYGLPAVVSRVIEDAGPANLPDPDSHQSRYTATVTLRVRGFAHAPAALDSMAAPSSISADNR